MTRACDTIIPASELMDMDICFERGLPFPREDIRRLLEMSALVHKMRDEVERLCGWKLAVIDALVVGFIYKREHDDDPRLALADLVSWENTIALDPAVSSSAQALVEKGLADGRAECAELRFRMDGLEK